MNLRNYSTHRLNGGQCRTGWRLESEVNQGDRNAPNLFNSLTRTVEPFAPMIPERVSMYVCGPTVYNYVHIGNARGPVVFGVLARLLRRHFPKLVYARNITDVDDKINQAAIDQGVPITAITDKFAAAYRDHMGALGVDLPDLEPHEVV